MKLREITDKINDVLLDEELLRLLCYAPENASDNPLSPSKPDILTIANQKDKWELINNHLMTAPNFYDLDKLPLSRLVFYAGNGKIAKDNHLFTNQLFHFDIYTHYTIENLDRRLEWISDRVNELLFLKKIGGIGKALFITRHPIISTSLPTGYVGYRLVYEFCMESW